VKIVKLLHDRENEFPVFTDPGIPEVEGAKKKGWADKIV